MCSPRSASVSAGSEHTNSLLHLMSSSKLKTTDSINISG